MNQQEREKEQAVESFLEDVEYQEAHWWGGEAHEKNKKRLVNMLDKSYSQGFADGIRERGLYKQGFADALEKVMSVKVLPAPEDVPKSTQLAFMGGQMNLLIRQKEAIGKMGEIDAK